jgi:medium-chain acyl-[acyl-carrier-protein] hydrolase
MTGKMEKQKLWTEHHQISWDDTSPAGTLNLSGLNILLQRAAVEHAEHLGFGFQQTSKQNITWVLINLSIEIYRLPKWREKIKLVTWPKSMEKLIATREFTVRSEVNEALCNASSEWLLIDLNTRRPQRMEIMSRFDQYLSNKTALSHPIQKADKEQVFRKIFSTTPGYSSLDMNGHTNARKYFEWLEDALFQVHGTQTLSQISMSYFHECKFGEKIEIEVGLEDNKTIRGWKPDQNQLAFIARVDFR